MHKVSFVTGNTEKFEIGSAACRQFDITLERAQLDIDEIQGEDSERIIRDKVQKAHTALDRPVVVSDDSWSIPGLHGFPGPYMKSMDHWLSTEDILNLTRPLKDRRIILVQLLAYQDGERQKIFRVEYEGTLLAEARGSYGKPFQKVISMPGDEGLSIAEAYDRGAVHAERSVVAGWQQFTQWYLEQFKNV